MNSLLPILILLPLLAGTLLSVFGAALRDVAYKLGLTVAGIVLLGSIVLLRQASETTALDSTGGMIQPHVIYGPAWMQLNLPIAIQGHPVNWQLQLGADGFGAAMVLLAAIVTLAVLLTARNQITQRLGLYTGLILITQSLLIGVFLSMDLLLFYLFFEAVLLPIILLINLWGDPKESLRASRKFLIFTLAGSIPMVVGLIGLVLQFSTKDKPSTVLMSELSKSAYATQLLDIVKPIAASENVEQRTKEAISKASDLSNAQCLIFCTLLLGIGIKMAILPLHSWLPTTYAAAHPNTTAMIAAVVGKLGAFGMLRIVLPFTPIPLIESFQWIIGGLGAVAIVYGAMVALGQTDLRRLLAYSSLSHMGFVTVGLMAMNREGLSGASLQMFNHGILTAAMFLLLGMIEARRGRITMSEESRGLASAYPKLGTLMVFFTLAGAGLPGLNGFVGEVLAMSGMTRFSISITAIAILGAVLGAWYSLRVLQYVMFGSDGSTKSKLNQSEDLRTADLFALIPIAVLAIIIGVFPFKATDTMKVDVELLSSRLEPAVRLMHPNVDSSMLVASPRK
jgi:NADH-quinone oxidoreductase subunit M